jgi:hypothetical protein
LPLTALLVLAIIASSALVFTNKVELLKLAVIIALWAAVVAAFVSFMYRRQSDLDQAKSRDLKMVYDLQLDREISARREYELSVETHLRRELAAELHAQASDEVASLRAELAALRANLEIIFDTDLNQRPAIETERGSTASFVDWGDGPKVSVVPERGDRGVGLGRVVASRIDAAEVREEYDPHTEESPIIDVPAVPHPPDDEWVVPLSGGAHRRSSEPERPASAWQSPRPDEPPVEGRRRAPEFRPEPRPAPEPEPRPQPQPRLEPIVAPEVRVPWQPPPATPAPPPPPKPEPEREPERVGRHAPIESEWRPAPAAGQFIPAGAPGSNWSSPVVPEVAPPAMPPPAPPAASAPAPPPASPPGWRQAPPVTPRDEFPMTPPPAPTMTPPPTEPPRLGRHTPTEPAAAEPPKRAKHSAPADAGDPGRRTSPPTLATPPPPPAPAPPPVHQPTQPEEGPEALAARHRGDDGEPTGGQSLSELMARLQASSTGGGRRRRREE